MGWWGRQEDKTEIARFGPCGVVLVLIVALALVAGSGCSQPQAPSSAESTSTAGGSANTTTSVSATTIDDAAAPATTAGAQATTVTTVGSAPAGGVPSTTQSTTATVAVSSDSVAYAKSLGGTSHEGQALYFVIGASVASERAAQAMLEDALPRFGDMQSYFIVQRSDNFEGMNPGWWVILEAYRNEPSPENLDFGRRGFPDAYVRHATVRTSDPIPVYEDMVEGL